MYPISGVYDLIMTGYARRCLEFGSTALDSATTVWWLTQPDGRHLEIYIRNLQQESPTFYYL